MIPLLAFPIAAALAAAPAIGTWERYEKQVRDQALPKDSLKAAFPAIHSALMERAPEPPSADSPWVFPVAGYSLSSVGKGGFKPDIWYGGAPVKGYDFFDGYRHGGHPAYDIFIRDKDQDSRDDRDKQPVRVVAPVGLTVISTEEAWEAESRLRGGKYVWALGDRTGLLFYFAHLDSVMAKPGDKVAAGGSLGTVGRTGKNAHPKRSPTHLHFMVLRVKDGAPRPFDYYSLLKR